MGGQGSVDGGRYCTGIVSGSAQEPLDGLQIQCPW